MIKINYKDLGIKLSPNKYKEELEKIVKSKAPDFEDHKPSLKDISDSLKDYKKFKNIIVVANGGSRTSGYAFYNALQEFRNSVDFEFVSSAEPITIQNTRRKYSKKNTLVLVISKSGENINNIEPMLALIDYPILVITGKQTSPLMEIARKKNLDIIYHPEVTGRLSGMTVSGLVPASLMGLNIKEIYSGAKSGYKKYSSRVDWRKNDALKLALYFADLEENGYTEIFAGIYSTSLFSFLPLMTQLVHETTGKIKKGQTIFGDYSPESQHHTNQRYFGGRRNIIGMFISEENFSNDTTLKIPKALEKINLKKSVLKKLNGLKGGQSMRFDMKGVVENSRKNKIPSVEILIDKITPKSIGEFMVFWQYFAIYSAYLRKQNPFVQPEVEASKNISLKLRINR